jgi:hypothetical protein
MSMNAVVIAAVFDGALAASLPICFIEGKPTLASLLAPQTYLHQTESQV